MQTLLPSDFLTWWEVFHDYRVHYALAPSICPKVLESHASESWAPPDVPRGGGAPYLPDHQAGPTPEPSARGRLLPASPPLTPEGNCSQEPLPGLRSVPSCCCPASGRWVVCLSALPPTPKTRPRKGTKRRDVSFLDQTFPEKEVIYFSLTRRLL